MDCELFNHFIMNIFKKLSVFEIYIPICNFLIKVITAKRTGWSKGKNLGPTTYVAGSSLWHVRSSAVVHTSRLIIQNTAMI